MYSDILWPARVTFSGGDTDVSNADASREKVDVVKSQKNESYMLHLRHNLQEQTKTVWAP